MRSLLLVQPTWKTRVDMWKLRIEQERNLISYLIVLRMGPVPPHGIISLVAPHLGVGLIPFWISTALGTAAVSFIHVTIGQKLEEITTPADMHLLSWRNALLLGGVILAALVPVAVRKMMPVVPLKELVLPVSQGALPLEEDQVPGSMDVGEVSYDVSSEATTLDRHS